ncbi:hypothetical protein IJ579_02525 [bacterium]|nr:hypothetical protein [bacterium]
MKQVVSKILELKKNKNISTDSIEQILSERFNDVVRWAIVDVGPDILKLSVSYKKGDN